MTFNKHPDFNEDGLHEKLNAYFGPQSANYKNKNVALYWLARIIVSEVTDYKPFINKNGFKKLIVPKMAGQFVSDTNFCQIYGISKNSKILLESEFE